MQSLKQFIYGKHLQRERDRAEPIYDPIEEDFNHETDEVRDRLAGFGNPANTVSVTVPMVSAWGEEYGCRVEMISPEIAGKRIDGDRETITHLREALAEQRYWRRFMARFAWSVFILNMFLIALLIGG